MTNRRVVITGWGLVTSLSCDVDDCWKRVLAGESGVHEVRLFDCSEIKVKMGADIWDWDASEIVGQKEANKMDRYSQFAMVAAHQAFEFSKFDPRQQPERLPKYGCVIGSGIGDAPQNPTFVFKPHIVASNLAARTAAIRAGPASSKTV